MNDKNKTNINVNAPGSNIDIQLDTQIEPQVRTHGKYHKIGAIIIIVSVIAGFMAFGIMDTIHSISSNTYIAKVGNVKIYNQEFEKAYRQQASKFVSQYGSSPQLDKIITSQDFKNIILSDLINKKLVVEYVKSTGINITYEMLMKIVKSDEHFLTQNVFDATKFKQYLIATDSNLEEYTQKLLYDISSNLILNNVISRPQLTESIKNEYLKFNNRKKDVMIYEINEDFLKKIEPTFKNTISQDKIIEYYSQNQSQYLIPQQRHIEYINLFDDLFKSNQISTQEAKAFYDTKIASAIQNSEKRSIYSALFNKESDAKLALKDLKSGVSFTNVVKKYLNLNAENTYLQNITKDDFDPALSKVIFSLNVGQTSQIIKTDIGYYIIKLDKINKDNTKTFANLENEIKNAIKFDRACEQAKQLFDKIEDFSISNPNFTSLKQQFKLNFSPKIIIQNPDPLVQDPFVDSVINTDPSSQYPLFIEDVTPSKTCNYYIAKIQKTIPQSYKSFESVKEQITQTLLLQAITQKLFDTAKHFATLTQKPSPTTETLQIADKNNKYFSSTRFYSALANLSPQNPISYPILYDNKVLVLVLQSQQKLDEINIDQSTNETNDKLKTEISKSLAEDSYSSLHKTLFAKLKVKIYNKDFTFVE